jgi:hypothetical protein
MIQVVTRAYRGKETCFSLASTCVLYIAYSQRSLEDAEPKPDEVKPCNKSQKAFCSQEKSCIPTLICKDLWGQLSPQPECGTDT